MDENAHIVIETSIWRERVRCEMEKIEQKNELGKKNEMGKVWQTIDDVCKNVTSSEETKKTWAVTSQDENLGAASLLPPKKCEVFTNEKKINAQCVGMKVMPMVTPPPTMTTWTPVLRNVRFSEADRQTNIPYLSEEIFEKDNTFILDLEKEYSINESPRNEDLKDNTFLDLVKGLEQYVGESEEPTEEASVDKSEEKTIVFEAIARYFSGSCTTGNLTKRYKDLTANKENLDVNQNEMSGEEAIHPFKSRICRRCLKYNCDLHKDDPKVDGPLSFKNIPDKIPLPASDPCGHHCFLHIPGVSFSTFSAASRISPSSGASRISPSSGWSRGSPSSGASRVSPSSGASRVSLSSGASRVSLSSGASRISPSFGGSRVSLSSGVSRVSPSGASRVSPSGSSRISSSSGASRISSASGAQLADDMESLHLTEKSTEVKWTSSERMMFRVLVKTFPNDFCTMSKALRTKQCDEVYKFSLQESNNFVWKESHINVQETHSGVPDVKKNAQKDRHRVFKSRHFGGDRDYTKPYRPCHHPGRVCDEGCTCISSGNFCEKFCYCSPDCRNRFPGCTCNGNCKTKHCACFLATRECDPDLCQTCGASQYHFDLESASCRNVLIQKNMVKKLLVAPSKVAGWGCFVDEDVVKNEFIGEYVGELINDEEANRRGKIYDKSNCSYMFKINDEFVIDAARVGNKLRFANHSDKPNCKPQIVMVNGDHRIGVYAGKNIAMGEELFYDYGNEFHGHGFKK